jgi:chemotaxis methyl-accepting protein methylase
MSVSPSTRRRKAALLKMSRSRLARKYIGRPYLLVNRWIWDRLPASFRHFSFVHWYGSHLHSLSQIRVTRTQYIGTFFFRNRPELELLNRLLDQIGQSSTLDMAVLGCSKGAEVYSFSYAIRTQRPDLNLRLCALDISKDVLEFAEVGVYALNNEEEPARESPVSLGRGGHVDVMTSKDQGVRSIFERMSPEEMEALFEGDGKQARVRPRFRDGITWRVGDANDPDLVEALGMQDVVVANRFLCHMHPDEAEACLRNLARLVKGGGYLFVSGVDLDVRCKVARDLGWRPVTELIGEIHEGDASLRRDWPLEYWGLEPFDLGRGDWKHRYASVFQLPERAATGAEGVPPSSQSPEVGPRAGAVFYTKNNGKYQDLNADGVGVPPPPQPHFVYQGVDGNDVQLYVVMWDTPGLQPFAVRVLPPHHPSINYPHSFLFDLPVEPGLAQSTYGNGLNELQRLGVQNQYNATIVEPIFAIDSWYADNPSDTTINFETFMSKYLPAWVDRNFATSGAEKNLLVGLSKSGYGALDLLFKHPSLFDAAAAFDFPADMKAYDDFGSSSSRNYGTDTNFQNNYRLTNTFIDTWKAPFTTAERIWISEGPTFQTHVANFSALLRSQGVSHSLSIQINDAHTWSGGWLSDAVSGLFSLEHCSVEHQFALTGREAGARGAKILRLKSPIPHGVTGGQLGGNPYPAILGLRRKEAVSSPWARVRRSAKIKRLIEKINFLEKLFPTRVRHEKESRPLVVQTPRKKSPSTK